MTDKPGMFSAGKHSRKGSKLGLIIAVSVAGVLGVGVAAGWWLVSHTEHPTAAGQHIEVRIPQGAGTEQIARMLSNYGVINNALMFEFDTKLGKSSLRPGTYQLSTGMPDDLVIKKLAAGLHGKARVGCAPLKGLLHHFRVQGQDHDVLHECGVDRGPSRRVAVHRRP